MSSKKAKKSTIIAGLIQKYAHKHTTQTQHTTYYMGINVTSMNE